MYSFIRLRNHDPMYVPSTDAFTEVMSQKATCEDSHDSHEI